VWKFNGIRYPKNSSLREIFATPLTNRVSRKRQQRREQRIAEPAQGSRVF